MTYRDTVRSQINHIETERVPYALRVDDPVVGAKQLQPETPVENAVAILDAFTE